MHVFMEPFFFIWGLVSIQVSLFSQFNVSSLALHGHLQMLHKKDPCCLASSVPNGSLERLDPVLLDISLCETELRQFFPRFHLIFLHSYTIFAQSESKGWNVIVLQCVLPAFSTQLGTNSPKHLSPIQLLRRVE